MPLYIIPHCLNPFISSGASWLLPKLGYHKQYCNQHGVQVILSYPEAHSFGCMPRCGITELYGNYV
jgi:hypothetical protein